MIHFYTVFGNPIEHSRSPEIHQLFSQQTQRQISYTRTLGVADRLSEQIQEFFARGGNGCNVTLPFKESVLSLCSWLSDDAKRAGAVNTLKYLPEGDIHGYNTDGSGLLADLRTNKQVTLAGQKILIAGAGGATRGIIAPLLREQPACLVIANRTVEKAQGLATDFADLGAIEACSYDQVPEGDFTLVINATSMSIGNDRPPLPDSAIGTGTTAYDLVYGKHTPFLDWAQANGAHATYDGTGMLIEQAADAFFYWEGVRPKTRLIVARL